MKTNSHKAPYEVPVVEVLDFQTSGSILTASNENLPVVPIYPFSESIGNSSGSSIDGNQLC